MSANRGQALADRADRLYSGLTRLFPPDFRRRFGGQMVLVFRDLRRHRRSDPQGGGLAVFWIREVGQLIGLAVQEWLRIFSKALGLGRQKWTRRPVEGGIRFMPSILQDLRVSLRAFLRQPLFTVVVVATIGLGIGANSAIFSVVNGVLLKPLGYPGSDRIVTIWEDFSAQGGPEREWIEVPNLAEWRRECDAFETMSAFLFRSSNLIVAGEPAQLTMGVVTFDYFDTFATSPSLGRSFEASDDRPDSQPVVILSHHFWRDRFSRDSSALGQSLKLDGVDYSIIGVLPEGFRVPQIQSVDVWSTLKLDFASAQRGNFFLQGVARLEEGSSLELALGQMNTLMDRIGSEFPTNRGVRIRLIPLLKLIVQPAETSLWVLLGAVAFILLIACANIANLMLGRGAARSREMAIRSAMGAGKGRLFRQLLTESLLLSMVGGLVGLLLAVAGVRALVALAPAGTPRITEVTLDGWVLAFTLGITLLTGILFGLLPALRGSQAEVGQSLKEGTRQGSDSSGRSGLRGALVVSEVALAVTLLIGAGLLVRSFQNLLQVELGFRPENLVSVRFSLTPDRYPQSVQLSSFLGTLLENLNSRPGLQAAAVSVLPLSGFDSDTGFRIEGRPEPTKPEEEPVAWYRQVTPSYFRTMGIPVLEGREFAPSDQRDSAGVVIVNQVTAQKYWPGEQVIGKQVRFGSRLATIVGLVPGIRHSSVDQPPRSELYLAYDQFAARRMNLVIRSSIQTSAIAELVRSEIKALDSQLPLSAFSTMEQLVASSVAQPRFFMGLTAAFSGLALLLAAVGIYGVLSYNVSRRTYEMGLRMALGAQRGVVLKLVMRQGLGWTAVGLVLGLLAAVGLTGFLSSLLFGISPTDPGTFLFVSLALLAVTLCACLFPAVRATRIDPLRSLRCE